MLIAGEILAFLAVLTLLVWIFKGRENSSTWQEVPRFHRVDTVAFRNLLSESEEEYLRTSLSVARYRKLRRSRLRAAQEYLFWIAQDCAAILTVIRLNSVQPSREAEAMARHAIRLRLISLGFWALLWAEYLIPALEIRPFRTLGNYEDFWRSAELYLIKQQGISAARG